MKRRVWETIREFHMLEPEEKVLCALSGGADSVSLLLCLAELGVDVCACHLNHGLRGEAADADEAFCRSLCEREGIPFVARRCDAAEEARCTGQSVETAARELRYRFFAACAEELGADKIATAHTADDNLETMLFRLIRGTGTAGLAGIPPVRDNIIRPLLRVERREIEAYLTARGQKWCTDATNNEDICTRNRIRHQVIPALREIVPEAAQHAAEAAMLLRQDDAALTALAQNMPETHTLHWMQKQPEAVRSRAIRRVLAAAGVPEGETGLRHIRAFERLCDGHGNGVSLPGGFRAERRRGCLVVLPTARRGQMVELELEKPVQFGSYWVCLTKKPQGNPDLSRTIALSCGIIAMSPLCLRGWSSRDRMRLSGARGERTLKRLYQERAIPPEVRDGLPVLCGARKLLAAAGIGASQDAAPHGQEDTLWLLVSKERERIEKRA